MPLLTISNVVAVGLGAAVGAWLRWALGLWLNTGGAWPWGTLVANLGGGYLIGLAIGAVALHPEWPQWVRLAAITGFLGGLTTFSTFSAETVTMLEQGRWGQAAAYVGTSVVCSLVLTGLGLYTVHAAGRA